MDAVKDPFEVVLLDEETDEFARLRRRPVAVTEAPAVAIPGAVTAQLQDFGIDERPLLAGLPRLGDELVPARTAVPLRRRHIGSTVVVLFEHNDVRRPIVMGVVQDAGRDAAVHADGDDVVVQRDDERLVLRAEREITLRCGDASITLTRAGKVIIKGRYVVSHSSGCNKIKGAAVEIN
jgi:Domain of unknown function (DUF6484)